MARAARLGEAAQARLRERLSGLASVGDIRGRGLMFGVEIVRDREGRVPAPELAEQIYYRSLAAGVSFKISAGNVLTLSPPLVIGEEDLWTALDHVASAVEAVTEAAGLC